MHVNPILIKIGEIAYGQIFARTGFNRKIIAVIPQSKLIYIGTKQNTDWHKNTQPFMDQNTHSRASAN